MFEDIAIVVPSCDKYSDLWEPFFANLKYKWPHNPLKMYLVTNNADFAKENLTVIKVGQDLSWSSNLKLALTQVEEPIVFLFIDDLFLKESVNQKTIGHLFQRFKTEKMNYLRFNPVPGPAEPIDADGIGPIKSGDYYRASTVMCLWNKQVLLDVLKEGESAWELELIGSERTDKYDGWYASARWLLPTINLVIKGKCDPVAYNRIKSAGIPLSDKRPLMNGLEYFRFLLIRLRAWLFTWVPRSLRAPIRRKLMQS